MECCTKHYLRYENERLKDEVERLLTAVVDKGNEIVRLRKHHQQHHAGHESLEREIDRLRKYAAEQTKMGSE